MSLHMSEISRGILRFFHFYFMNIIRGVFGVKQNHTGVELCMFSVAVSKAHPFRSLRGPVLRPFATFIDICRRFDRTIKEIERTNYWHCHLW